MIETIISDNCLPCLILKKPSPLLLLLDLVATENGMLFNELLTAGWNQEVIRKALAQPRFKDIVSISDLSEENHAHLEGILESLTNAPPMEEFDDILKRQVFAIFAYGTLRADYSPSGDKWGIVNDGCCWTKATVKSFRIYQKEGNKFPFAAHTDCESDTISGTLLWWDDKSVFVEKLRQCNSIEGFDILFPHKSIYSRVVVDASVCSSQPEPFTSESVPGARFTHIIPPVKTQKAYMYYQEAHAHDLQGCLEFPAGDWLGRS